MPDGQGLDAAAGFQHAIAVPFQDILDDPTDRGLILHYQDGFGAAADRSVGPLLGTFLRTPVAGRQVNLKSRALTELTLHFDPALVAFDDSIDRGQSQTGAFAKFFGRKKRLENAAENHLVHSRTAIN